MGKTTIDCIQASDALENNVSIESQGPGPRNSSGVVLLEPVHIISCIGLFKYSSIPSHPVARHQNIFQHWRSPNCTTPRLLLCLFSSQLHALCEERERSAASAPPLSPTKPSGIIEPRGRVTSALSAEPTASKEAVGRVGVHQPPPDPAALESLADLCPPGVGMEFLCHVLQARCLGDLEVSQ